MDSSGNPKTSITGRYISFIKNYFFYYDRWIRSYDFLIISFLIFNLNWSVHLKKKKRTNAPDKIEGKEI
jgi:hypothetical protein